MLLCIGNERGDGSIVIPSFVIKGGDGMSYLLKGLLIGLIFGMPVGAVGTMTVQRTLKYGFRAGFITGLGSSIADCLYACVGVFGLTFISDFLLKYQRFINILGGTFVAVIGLRLLIGKEKQSAVQKQVNGGMKMFLSSFTVGITNPAVILTFLFAFSYFEIADTEIFTGILLVVGVFIGTCIWWGSLSAAVSLIKKKTENYSLCHMNKIFGTILTAFGAAVFIKTFLP